MKTLGFSPRLGFGLREDLTLQLRYSIFQQEIGLPSALRNCNNNFGDPNYNPSPAFMNANNIWDGRASAATPMARPLCRSVGSWSAAGR